VFYEKSIGKIKENMKYPFGEENDGFFAYLS